MSRPGLRVERCDCGRIMAAGAGVCPACREAMGHGSGQPARPPRHATNVHKPQARARASRY